MNPQDLLVAKVILFAPEHTAYKVFPASVYHFVKKICLNMVCLRATKKCMDKVPFRDLRFLTLLGLRVGSETLRTQEYAPHSYYFNDPRRYLPPRY